jgi:hypothetical protein
MRKVKQVKSIREYRLLRIEKGVEILGLFENGTLIRERKGKRIGWC